jgi:hypothetical protein
MRWIIILLLAPCCFSQTLPTHHKLIEFGWDEPDTSFMRVHVLQMEATPFDGCVFHLNYMKDAKTPANFGWECWGKRAFKASELQAATDDLQATKFRRFSENFLRFNAVPGDIDWFDDYTPVLQNIWLAANIAKLGGCRGILLDTEQYDGKIFDYTKQRDAKTRSWDDYGKQVRLRGSQFMNALQKADPDCTIFMTFAYTLLLDQAEGDSKKLPQISYGLLAPFLDGMLDAAGPRIKFVDGYEESYGYKTAAEFAIVRQRFSIGVLKGFIADPKKYQQHFQLGYGIWLDLNWRTKGWSDTDLSKNYFTPESFEVAVGLGLSASDQYVWIYTEQPRWWSIDGATQKLPAAYLEALRHVRRPE